MTYLDSDKVASLLGFRTAAAGVVLMWRRGVDHVRLVPPVRLAMWKVAARHWGPLHPFTRAKFGRYVGSIRGVLTAVSSGPEAWVACYRELGHAGFWNRTWRRHLGRSVTPQTPDTAPPGPCLPDPFNRLSSA